VDEPSLVIEPFSPLDRAAFSCGQPALDAYLQRQASQDVRRRVAQVFVAVGERPEKIAALSRTGSRARPSCNHPRPARARTWRRVLITDSWAEYVSEKCAFELIKPQEISTILLPWPDCILC
jgi:hypothetical protein